MGSNHDEWQQQQAKRKTSHGIIGSVLSEETQNGKQHGGTDAIQPGPRRIGEQGFIGQQIGRNQILRHEHEARISIRSINRGNKTALAIQLDLCEGFDFRPEVHLEPVGTFGFLPSRFGVGIMNETKRIVSDAFGKWAAKAQPHPVDEIEIVLSVAGSHRQRSRDRLWSAPVKADRGDRDARRQ